MEQSVAGFDVVHIHAVFSHASLAAVRACRRHRVPYVVRPLGSLDPWSMRQKAFRKRVFWHAGVARMLKEASAIHYTSGGERRLAEKSLGLNHGVVIPLGINAELYGQGDARKFNHFYPEIGEDPYVLVLSRLHPKKGLELFLEVFLKATAQPEFKQWKLVLAGNGEDSYIESLRKIVEEGKASGRVIFTGWVEGEKKLSALRDASLLVLPSKQENFGLCITEALACGVPVLVSRDVNIAEDVEDAGAGWACALDRDALADALMEALSDKTERGRRGALGREWVRRRFAWPAIASELKTLYASIS